MTTAMQPERRWPPSPPARAVRIEQWPVRTFYASPCRFFIDVPLDMSGCVMAATREAAAIGHKLVVGGATFATDAIYRGAILVEVEEPQVSMNSIVRIEGEVLARSLPEKGVRLRGELDELARWALDIGYEISAMYVLYSASGSMPGAVRATEIYASMRGEPPPE